MKYIGLDIGGTKCAATVAALDEKIEILDKIQFPTANSSPMLCIRVPAVETFKIQEYHLPIYHALCAMLECEKFV